MKNVKIPTKLSTKSLKYRVRGNYWNYNTETENKLRWNSYCYLDTIMNVVIGENKQYPHFHKHLKDYWTNQTVTANWPQVGLPELWQQRICLQCRTHGFNSWVRKTPWRKEWQPTPVFLLGEFHGQKTLVGCSPRGHKELSNLIEWLSD